MHFTTVDRGRVLEVALESN